MNAMLRRATVSALLAAAAAGQQASDFHFVAWGLYIGYAGVQVTADARGPAIVVSGDYWRYWTVLRPDGAGGYRMDFVSPVAGNSGEGYVCLVCADVLPAAGPEVLVGRPGTVELWQLQTGTLLRRLQAPASLQSVAAADLDGDGTVELVLASPSEVRVVRRDGTVLASRTGAGGAVVAAQLDGDAPLEVAVGSGQVFEGVQLTPQWAWAPGFGAALRTGDVDGDGIDELLGGDGGNQVWCYDVDLQLPKYALPVHPGGGNLGAFDVANLDGDPAPEIAIGDQQRQLVIYDGATQALQQTIPISDYSVCGLALGDCDGDGQRELVFGTDSGTAKAHLWIADPATLALEWRSPEYDAPVFGPFRGDFDGDQQQELVLVTTRHAAGYQPPRVLLFDPQTRQLRREYSVLSSAVGVTDVHAVDLDGDGDLELAVCNNGVDWLAWNGAGFGSVLRLSNGASRAVSRDLDGDGLLDVVAAATTGLGAYHLPGLQPMWSQALSLPLPVQRLNVGDVDFDGGLEVAVISSGQLRVLNAATGAAEAAQPLSASSLDAVPLLPTGAVLVAGDLQGNLTVLLPNGSGYAPLGPLPVRQSRIRAASLLPGTSWPLILADDGLTLHSGLWPVWQSFAVGAGAQAPTLDWPSLTLFVGCNAGCFGFQPR